MTELAIQDNLDIDEAMILPDEEVQVLLNQFELPSLPQYSWKKRPPEHPITRREACAAICEAKGNLTRAAQMLFVTRARLHGFVKRDSFTQSILEEVQEMIVDDAASKVHELIESEDPSLAFQASKFVLTNYKAGRDRGFGPANGNNTVNINGAGDITIGWLDDKQAEKEGYYDPADDHRNIDANNHRVLDAVEDSDGVNKVAD